MIRFLKKIAVNLSLFGINIKDIFALKLFPFRKERRIS